LIDLPRHTAKGTADQEPWVHGPEHEAIRRKYIELRYELMPYLYTGIEETSRTGLPLMRPVFLEYPQASEFYGDNRDFLFGRDFFVAPVTTEMGGRRRSRTASRRVVRLLDKREVVEQRKDHFASAARRDAALRARGCHRADAATGAIH